MTRTHLLVGPADVDAQHMDIARDEARLLEIQYKIGDLGRRDDFNLSTRRDALERLEIILSDRVAKERASVGVG